MNTEELRRLAENVLDEGLSTANRIMFARRYQERADAKTILSLLDELDDLRSYRNAAPSWTERTEAAEQRVAALEELAERYHSQHSETGTACRCHLCKELRTLQASAQAQASPSGNASEGSGK